MQSVIENVIKYGDGNRLELLFPESDESVLICVRNNYSTLDKTDLPHIFESFQHGTNSQNFQGSKLRLYI